MENKDKFEYYMEIQEKLIIGKPTKNNLLIMPCHLEIEFLKRHLRCLNKQTFKDFDLLIIGSPYLEKKKIIQIYKKIKKIKFNSLIFLRRKNDTGAAGAFFLGQRYALEKGYKKIINVEADCIPQQKDLIQKLIENTNSNCVALPIIRLYDKSKYCYSKESGPNQYCCIESSLLGKTGLYYAPLYIGAEDSEFLDRIKREAKIIKIERSIRHPLFHNNEFDINRYIRYNSNHLIIKEDIMYKFLFIFSASVYLLFGTEPFKKYVKNVTESLIFNRIGKEVKIEKSKKIIKKLDLKEYEIIIKKIEEKDGLNNNYRRILNEFILYLTRVFSKSFRKIVIMNYFPRAWHIYISCGMILSKQFWVRTKNLALLASDNSKIINHLSKLIFLPFFTLFLFIFYSFIFMINYMRKPKTKNFGLID
ncbi:MAG: glycosyltransferase family A protein [Candidatus Anstonellaceae archaeon]